MEKKTIERHDSSTALSVSIDGLQLGVSGTITLGGTTRTLDWTTTVTPDPEGPLSLAVFAWEENGEIEIDINTSGEPWTHKGIMVALVKGTIPPGISTLTDAELFEYEYTLVPEPQALTELKARIAARSQLKKFTELTEEEKEELLAKVAVQTGLCAPE